MTEVITALWECAKEKNVEVSGMSWNGFNLMGDRKSIDEVNRLMFEEVRLQAVIRQLEKCIAKGEKQHDIGLVV